MEHVRWRPTRGLTGHVGSYTGYRVAGVEPGEHAGLPSKSLTFIVSFDEPLDITAMPDRHERPGRFWAMVGGLHTTPATVRHRGYQHGIQIELTPRGALTVFGVRPADLCSKVVGLDELDAPLARQLLERLDTAPDWTARFRVVDELLASRIALGRGFDLPVPIAAAWDLLVRSAGQVGVQTVAEHVGWGRRHLHAEFRRSFGIAPKQIARVLRFERAQQLLRAPSGPSLARVAAECGYADQSHLSRDWREFAGCPPTAWLAAELPFVQDIDASAPSGSQP